MISSPRHSHHAVAPVPGHEGQAWSLLFRDNALRCHSGSGCLGRIGRRTIQVPAHPTLSLRRPRARVCAAAHSVWGALRRSCEVLLLLDRACKMSCAARHPPATHSHGATPRWRRVICCRCRALLWRQVRLRGSDPSERLAGVHLTVAILRRCCCNVKGISMSVVSPMGLERCGRLRCSPRARMNCWCGEARVWSDVDWTRKRAKGLCTTKHDQPRAWS